MDACLMRRLRAPMHSPSRGEHRELADSALARNIRKSTPLVMKLGLLIA